MANLYSLNVVKSIQSIYVLIMYNMTIMYSVLFMFFFLKYAPLFFILFCAKVHLNPTRVSRQPVETSVFNEYLLILDDLSPSNYIIKK